jgi:hypothetical protein
LTLGSGLTAIRESAFANNLLEHVVIPNRVTVIGECAFENNRITGVTIGNRVSEIGGRAFAGNLLTGVIIPDSVDTVGLNAFGDDPVNYTYKGKIMITQRELEAALRKEPQSGSFR